MASLLKLLGKTVKRGSNVVTNSVRRVGKAARKTVKVGTNAIGLTKRSRKSRSRKNRK